MRKSIKVLRLHWPYAKARTLHHHDMLFKTECSIYVLRVEWQARSRESAGKVRYERRSGLARRGCGGKGREVPRILQTTVHVDLGQVPRAIRPTGAGLEERKVRMVGGTRDEAEGLCGALPCGRTTGALVARDFMQRYNIRYIVLYITVHGALRGMKGMRLVRR